MYAFIEKICKLVIILVSYVITKSVVVENIIYS